MSSIIAGNQRIEVPGVTINTWQETGLDLPPRAPYNYSRTPHSVQMIILHWTAGFRGDPAAVRRVFLDRGVGCHFLMDRNGVLHQYLDTDRAGVHATPAKKSIGIEIQNPGLIINGRDDGRPLYSTELIGRERQFLRFTDAQIRSARLVCRAMCQHYGIPYSVPTNPDGTLFTNRFNTQQIRSYRGICGHYHTSNRGKLDPGTDLLNAILADSGGSSPLAAQTPTDVPPAVPPSTRRRPTPPTPETPPLERREAITQNRTSPPEGDLGYAVIGTAEDEARSIDLNAGAVIDTTALDNIINQPFENFKSQMDALRGVETIDFASAVPVLAVFTFDENNELVNLNKEIFGISSFHNIFEASEIPEGVEVINKERALASLESWSVNIQQPSVGGIAGISLGNLSIKVHNPAMVKTSHPKGKYISYLLRQGYPIRVRYGVSHPQEEFTEAFQWIEEDYFVSQHSLKTNDDQSLNVQLTLMPATQKLFNQILIGESIPVQSISQTDTAAVAAQAAEQREDASQRQIQSDLETILRQTGTPDGALGLNDFQNQDGTIYSVLHGAVSRLDRIRNSDNFEPIRISNLVNALQTLQSRLLTQRFENLLNARAYRYTGRGSGDEALEYQAANLGPMFIDVVKPELNRVVELVAQQGINIGPVYSNDLNALQTEESANRDGQSAPPPRNNVKMVFGRFNSYAGQWANKAISTFPVPIESVLAHIRRERSVGRFSDSLNNFIGQIGSTIAEPTNYVVDTSNSGENTHRLEIPQIKYSFYPDPSNDTDWIFYLYDNKDRAVLVSNLIDQINAEGEVPTKENILRILNEQKIPWVEQGAENSLVRSMTGDTQSDDTIMTHNIIQANSRVFSQRDMDGSSQTEVPSGITRELMSGVQLNARDIIRHVTLVMPLRLSIDHYIVVRGILFNPIYVFFPMKQFTGLYTIFEMGHEVQNGRVSTKLTCQIELTRQNRSPDS